MTSEKWLTGLSAKNQPDEFESKQLLAAYGIRTPPARLLSPNEALSIGLPNIIEKSSLTYPLVAKVCDPNILHKTDSGGVELNLNAENGPDKIRTLSRRFPESRILVENMIRYHGTEFIIGGLVDPNFGPAVMCGAGGILTELYKDISFRLAPLNRVEARRMLRELTISEVLEGYRGSKMDLDGLADLLSTIGDIIVDMGDRFSQLDVNPVVFDGERWVALDACFIIA